MVFRFLLVVNLILPMAFMGCTRGGHAPGLGPALGPSWTPEWANIGGYWKLDGVIGPITAGTPVYDSSGQGANGAFVGSRLSFVPGYINQGISVVSICDSYVNIPATVGPNSCSALTGIFWWQSSVAPSAYAIVFSKDDNITGYEVQVQGSGPSLQLRIDTSGGTNQVVGWNSADNFFDGNWHQVAFSLNSGNVVLYKEGAQDSTGTYLPGSGFCNPSQVLIIGCTAVGNIDEFALWNTALTASEVQTVYEGQQN